MGGRYLPAHMLNTRDNDHVEVAELRGFASENLTDAVFEVDALAKGTNCRKPWFSTSINPPQNADTRERDFYDAIERCEKGLGLNDQPRAVIFHEKEGRRHCHVIWSRINPENLKAIPDSYSRMRLQDVSRRLYLDHGWPLPEGLKPLGERDPNDGGRDVSRDDKAIAERSDLAIDDHQKLIREAWAQSDDLKSLTTALRERGYEIASGRRGPIALDVKNLDVHSLPRRLGLKKKEIMERIGADAALPDLQSLRDHLRSQQPSSIERAERLNAHINQIRELRDTQRTERKTLLARQSDERAQQEGSFAKRLTTQLKTFFNVSRAEFERLRDKFAGRDKEREHQAKIVELRKTLEERFADQRDALRWKQLAERQKLQKSIEAARLEARQHALALRQQSNRQSSVEAEKQRIKAKLERDRLQGRKLDR